MMLEMWMTTVFSHTWVGFRPIGDHQWALGWIWPMLWQPLFGCIKIESSMLYCQKLTFQGGNGSPSRKMDMNLTVTSSSPSLSQFHFNFSPQIVILFSKPQRKFSKSTSFITCKPQSSNSQPTQSFFSLQTSCQSTKWSYCLTSNHNKWSPSENDLR